jgi:UDP-N-acetylmuramoyl-tripeptide--D-alanyl-D-alanine ligase
MWIPLYWLYLWQIKEYRWDRLLSHLRLLSLFELLRTFGWGRYRRPRFTSKLLLISVIAGIFMVLCVLFFGIRGYWLLGIVVAWLTSPIDISFAVIFVSLIEIPIKQRLIQQAHNKAQTLLTSTHIIGVTGSYGKTTTKEFLAQLLSTSFSTLKTPTHVNQTLPLANFINQDIQAAPDILVVEYASYGVGNIAYDTKYVIAPTWAILTGLAPQHLELFGSLEKIVDAKFELIEALPPDGVVFYNQDDALLTENIHRRVAQEAIGYSAHDSDAWLAEVSWINSLKGRILKTMFASNVAAAVAVAVKKGVTSSNIKQSLETIAWLPRTLEVLALKPFTIIDDSYSSNSYGFEKLIRLVEKENYSAKILITSGIIELGEASYEINSALAQKAASTFDTVYITNAALAPAWCHSSNKIMHLPEDAVIKKVQSQLIDNSLLVLEGRIPERIRLAFRTHE